MEELATALLGLLSLASLSLVGLRVLPAPPLGAEDSTEATEGVGCLTDSLAIAITEFWIAFSVSTGVDLGLGTTLGLGPSVCVFFAAADAVCEAEMMSTVASLNKSASSPTDSAHCPHSTSDASEAWNV